MGVIFGHGLFLMCRMNYEAIWYHVTGPEGHCPNFRPNHVELLSQRIAESEANITDMVGGQVV